LGSITIESDAGRYQIAARKVKSIRLSGSAVKPGAGEGDIQAIRGTVVTTLG